MNVQTVVSPANLQEKNTYSEYANRLEKFQAIDSWLREYEQRTQDWPMLAKMCIECETEELWREGPYHSWDDWVNKAAPKSARTVYYYRALYKGLAQMPPEAAKQMNGLSPSVRRDRAVREAAKAGKQHLIATVQAAYPEQHLEGTTKVTFHFENSFISVYDEFLEGVRLLEDDPELERERAMELAIFAWFNQPWGDSNSGLTNLTRINQMRGEK